MNESIDLSLFPTTVTQSLKVPNKFPTIASEYRLALVGEAPGADEVRAGEPFVGPSGRLLDGLLSRNNILRSSCFVGNVCQHRPPNNDIEAFDWNGPEIQEGLVQLAADLAAFQPNLVVCLGATALRAACGSERSIINWRGSLFMSHWGYKCLAAIHPAACMPNRMPEAMPLLGFDLKKAAMERQSPELHLPIRNFDLNLTADEIVDRLSQMQHSGLEVSIDIEGTLAGIPCISFTTDPLGGMIVPFEKEQGMNYWEVAEDEAKCWWAVKQLLEDVDCPKVLQNQLYDGFVLAYGHGILIRNVKHDTLLMHWEKYCELKKSLALQASIYTREPYWKFMRTENEP